MSDTIDLPLPSSVDNSITGNLEESELEGVPIETVRDVVRVTPTLLTTLDGLPMTFYVAPCSKRTQIQDLILVCNLEL